MTYENLLRFLLKDMRMHGEVYQPWIILHLVKYGGESTLDSMARNFPNEYETGPKKLAICDRLGSAARKVLAKHGVVQVSDTSHVVLNTPPLSSRQSAEVVRICTLRIKTERLDGRRTRAELTVEVVQDKLKHVPLRCHVG